MKTRRLLFSWIGHADLAAMVASLPGDEGEQLSADLRLPRLRPGESGPLKCLLDQESFDEIHLLSNYGEAIDRRYHDWLDRSPIIHPVELRNPSDYREVFGIADAQLASVLRVPRHERLELCIHLSPGTPTMTAIWVLLGKSRFHPATFFQTHGGRAWVEEVPFDLVVDFVPQLLKDADANLLTLASQSPRDVRGFESIVGESRVIRQAVGRAQRAARREVPILLLGESGTGKEMFAKAIHEASPRRGKPFVAINCAALSKELLESELFGHKKGAFTGADADRDGAFKLADGGTLFLDEIGECDLAMQAKLLRVLQPPDHEPSHRVFHRVGDSRALSSDVRIIAATNRDLIDAMSGQKFRADLYYRVAVIPIKLPPLRERREDIPLIVGSLMDRINRNFERQEPGFRHKSISGSAMEFVKKYPWPGNVRQLLNTLIQAAVMTDDASIERRDLADAIADVPGTAKMDLLELPLGAGFSLDEHLAEIQRHYLKRAMHEAGGVKKRAAEMLGIKNYQTLAAQLERLSIEVPGP